jgi:spermidine synthase
MGKVFKDIFLYWGAMPTYPTGIWTYTMGTKNVDPRIPLRLPPEGLKYYSEDIHKQCFTLPVFIKHILHN